ncbi:hypothetical protein RFM26_32030 [Mesorhizobium sp. VK23B]|uniref:Uncharacterized protein n=1 Tax=Mesorhizobium dulcispinae TaxID=3072316 RepID=A0ABU4XQ56_9HYPH|nr:MULTISPECIES: hypothetical protein [unclassified Mesorhizobium]MDX8470310.1 hypothetical protein [Mesorhizobium sp. VK23B]MDX8476703.1 hypothetical protein [Mesorhizobium sp. VK23A]MDX8522685.1 hypothetical protein [Mesorhizobium sp. VK23D]TIW22910.1 MAG: hypothetical protein E5V65_02670 [Mesorhizobium sp.]
MTTNTVRELIVGFDLKADDDDHLSRRERQLRAAISDVKATLINFQKRTSPAPAPELRGCGPTEQSLRASATA